MVETGVVYGRFQIMHLKHLEYILAAKMRCSRLYIGITLPDDLYIPDGEITDPKLRKSANPMTWLERFEMIRDCLLDFGVPRNEFDIIPFPMERPFYLKRYMPVDATCFLSICDEDSRMKAQLFAQLGIPTEVLFERSESERGVTGSEVRQRILAGEKWSDLVPKSVFEYVTSHGIDDRIKFTK